MARPLKFSWNIIRTFPTLLVAGYSEIKLARVRQLKLLHDAEYLQKCAFMLSAGKRNTSLAHELQRLPTINIVNWGYQFDRFLEGKPASEAIRPLLSKKSFPYPLRH